ncbi:MAG: hypothetical protein ACYDH5_19235 [Acidimicrobiales bacterium]
MSLPPRGPLLVRGIAGPAGVFVASRAGVLAVAWSLSLVMHRPVLRLLAVWDSAWYRMAAMRGYPRVLPVVSGHVGMSTAAFLPAFPLSLAALARVSGLPYRVAGLVLSGLFAMAASVALWWLVREIALTAPEGRGQARRPEGQVEREAGRATGAGGRGPEVAAGRAAVAFSVFPGAVVFSFGYADGLMLACAITSLLALLKRRFLVAGLLAGLATATGPIALALVPAMAFGALSELRGVLARRKPGQPGLLRQMLAPVAATLISPWGFVAFQAYLWARTGNVLAWFDTQHQAWGQHLSLSAPVTMLVQFAKAPFSTPMITLDVAGMAFIVLAGAALVSWKPPGALAVYTVAAVAVSLFSPQVGPQPRFLLDAFPLVAAVGWRVRGYGFAGLAGTSAMVMVALFVVMSTTLAVTP